MMTLCHASPAGLNNGMPMDAFSRALKLLEGKHPKGTMDDIGATVILFWDPTLPQGTLEITLEDGSVSTVPMAQKRAGVLALIPVPCTARLKPQGLPGWSIGVTPNATLRSAPGATTPVSLVPRPVSADAIPGTAEALRWLIEGELGESSRALCARLMGFTDAFPEGAAPPVEGEVFTAAASPTNHPRDPADLRRCVGFFRAVPQARDRLPLMADVSPSWATLVPIWDELEVLLAQELAAGARAPQTYARMKEVLDAVPTPSRPRP